MFIYLILIETCFTVANDDLKGKINHFTGFYTNSISLNLAIVRQLPKSLRTSTKPVYKCYLCTDFTWYSEKVMISYSYMRGFMPNFYKKSWMVSNSQAAIVCAECVNLLEKFKSRKRYTEEFFSKLSCTMGSNQFWRTIRICLFKGWCLAKVGFAGWAAAADVLVG